LYSVRETEPTQKLPLSISLMNLLRHISQACSMLPIWVMAQLCTEEIFKAL